MGVEFFISRRYLFTKRKEKFISLISVITIAGVAIGVAALMVVIGVMSGFDKDLKEKIVGNYSHLTVASYKAIEDSRYPELAEKIYGNKHVVGVSPYLQGQVLAMQDNRFFAVSLKGISPKEEVRVSKIKECLTRGSIESLDASAIIIGKELAAYLGLDVGSSMAVYSPQGKQFVLRVVGIFNTGMYEYDMNLVFTGLKTAQDILGMPGQISSIGIKLDNLDSADRVRGELASVLGVDFSLKTWSEINRNFFAALKLEKLTMFIILTLIILVASFNIASTLIVMVVEKTKDIGILKAIGMTCGSIRRIFIYEGLIIGGLGILLGGAGGGLLCFLLKKYQFIKLPQDIYYIDRLPVSIVLWPDIVLILFSALVVTLISTVYPAIKAAGLKPVEALRYE
ncbi:MAG: ABC transporter permease [Candidatus Omnitrophota bacterium]